MAAVYQGIFDLRQIAPRNKWRTAHFKQKIIVETRRGNVECKTLEEHNNFP